MMEAVFFIAVVVRLLNSSGFPKKSGGCSNPQAYLKTLVE